MKILLVEPNYYTQYPPLGLLKLSTLYKSQGHEVKFVHKATHDARWQTVPAKVLPPDADKRAIAILMLDFTWFSA